MSGIHTRANTLVKPTCPSMANIAAFLESSDNCFSMAVLNNKQQGISKTCPKTIGFSLNPWIVIILTDFTTGNYLKANSDIRLKFIKSTTHVLSLFRFSLVKFKFIFGLPGRVAGGVLEGEATEIKIYKNKRHDPNDAHFDQSNSRSGRCNEHFDKFFL